ncbi:MAG: hypothetical protein QOE77_4218 [Blastocatellia bacterium]|nr:hypothetical protein [Blastocatellia bacterium]
MSSFEQVLGDKFVKELISALQNHPEVVQCSSSISSDISPFIELESVPFVPKVVQCASRISSDISSCIDLEPVLESAPFVQEKPSGTDD